MKELNKYSVPSNSSFYDEDSVNQYIPSLSSTQDTNKNFHIFTKFWNELHTHQMMIEFMKSKYDSRNNKITLYGLQVGASIVASTVKITSDGAGSAVTSDWFRNHIFSCYVEYIVSGVSIVLNTLPSAEFIPESEAIISELPGPS